MSKLPLRYGSNEWLRYLLKHCVITNWLSSVGCPIRVLSFALPIITTIRSRSDRLTLSCRRVYFINSQCRSTWLVVSIPSYGKSLPNLGHNLLHGTSRPVHPVVMYVTKIWTCWNSIQNLCKLASKWFSSGQFIKTCNVFHIESLNSLGTRVRRFSLQAFITWKWHNNTRLTIFVLVVSVVFQQWISLFTTCVIAFKDSLCLSITIAADRIVPRN